MCNAFCKVDLMSPSQAVRQWSVLWLLCSLKGIGSPVQRGGGIMFNDYRRHPMHTRTADDLCNAYNIILMPIINGEGRMSNMFVLCS